MGVRPLIMIFVTINKAYMICVHSALCHALFFAGFFGTALLFCYNWSTFWFFPFPSFGRAVRNGKQINAFFPHFCE